MLQINYSTILIATLILSTTAKIAYLVDVGNPGARYPIADIYDAKNISDSLKGQLNTVGMRQQYLLGTYIRADYIDKMQLLPGTFNPKTMEVYVSSIDRTIDTALSRMYGFYPLGHGWKIPEEVSADKLEPPFFTNSTFNLRNQDGQFALQNGFTPIPLTFLDSILNDACTNLGILKTKRYQQISKTIAKFQGQVGTFLAKLKLVFNLSTLQMNIQKMAELYDTILCDITLGKQIPSAFDQSDMRQLKYISDYYNTILYDGTFGRTVATLLLTEIQIRLFQIIQDPLSPKRYSAYFPSEPTLFPVLVILNMTSTDCLTQKYKNQTVTALNCMSPPSFSANLLIELIEDDSFQYQIKVKYNGQYGYLCEKKKYECAYEQFWGRVSVVVDRSSYQNDCYGK